jgi:hypothetical protein
MLFEMLSTLHFPDKNKIFPRKSEKTLKGVRKQTHRLIAITSNIKINIANTRRAVGEEMNLNLKRFLHVIFRNHLAGTETEPVITHSSPSTFHFSLFTSTRAGYRRYDECLQGKEKRNSFSTLE